MRPKSNVMHNDDSGQAIARGYSDRMNIDIMSLKERVAQEQEEWDKQANDPGGVTFNGPMASLDLVRQVIALLERQQRDIDGMRDGQFDPRAS